MDALTGSEVPCPVAGCHVGDCGVAWRIDSEGGERGGPITPTVSSPSERISIVDGRFGLEGGVALGSGRWPDM